MPIFCFLSGRSGLLIQLRPVDLQSLQDGGALRGLPGTPALSGCRGAGFCSVRVSFRPRTFFWSLRLLGHRALLTALGVRLLLLLLLLYRLLLERGSGLLRLLWPLLFRVPRWLLIQHPLKDLVGPVQLRHGQDHVDDPPATIQLMAK